MRNTVVVPRQGTRRNSPRLRISAARKCQRAQSTCHHQKGRPAMSCAALPWDPWELEIARGKCQARYRSFLPPSAPPPWQPWSPAAHGTSGERNSSAKLLVRGSRRCFMGASRPINRPVSANCPPPAAAASRTLPRGTVPLAWLRLSLSAHQDLCLTATLKANAADFWLPGATGGGLGRVAPPGSLASPLSSPKLRNGVRISISRLCTWPRHHRFWALGRYAILANFTIMSRADFDAIVVSRTLLSFPNRGEPHPRPQKGNS